MIYMASQSKEKLHKGRILVHLHEVCIVVCKQIIVFHWLNRNLLLSLYCRPPCCDNIHVAWKRNTKASNYSTLLREYILIEFDFQVSSCMCTIFSVLHTTYRIIICFVATLRTVHIPCEPRFGCSTCTKKHALLAHEAFSLTLTSSDLFSSPCLANVNHNIHHRRTFLWINLISSTKSSFETTHTS